MVAADMTRRRYRGRGPDQGNRVLRRGLEEDGEGGEQSPKMRNWLSCRNLMKGEEREREKEREEVFRIVRLTGINV